MENGDTNDEQPKPKPSSGRRPSWVRKPVYIVGDNYNKTDNDSKTDETNKIDTITDKIDMTNTTDTNTDENDNVSMPQENSNAVDISSDDVSKNYTPDENNVEDSFHSEIGSSFIPHILENTFPSISTQIQWQETAEYNHRNTFSQALPVAPNDSVAENPLWNRKNDCPKPHNKTDCHRMLFNRKGKKRIPTR